MGMPPLPPRPPGPGAMPPGAPPAGGPPAAPMGAAPGGGGAAADLAELQAMLPPQYQKMVDPKNPIMILQYTRLKNLPEADGQALLSLVGMADKTQLKALKTAFPELYLLLDLFDDGEINNSLGDAGAPPSMPSGGGMPPRPAGPPSMGAAGEPDDDEDASDEEQGEAPPRPSRISMIG